MKVLLLSGSLRAGSSNEAALRTVEEVAARGIVATRFEGMAALPHFNPDDDHDPLPAPVAALRDAIREADALLVCTPEYAGDMPGSFKNLLDWTVGGMETVDKPAAWINISTSPSGATGTHRALCTVLTYTGCRIVDDACAHIPVPRDTIVDGVVTDTALRARLAEVLRALEAAVS